MTYRPLLSLVPYFPENSPFYFSRNPVPYGWHFSEKDFQEFHLNYHVFLPFDTTKYYLSNDKFKSIISDFRTFSNFLDTNENSLFSDPHVFLFIKSLKELRPFPWAYFYMGFEALQPKS